MSLCPHSPVRSAASRLLSEYHLHETAGSAIATWPAWSGKGAGGWTHDELALAGEVAGVDLCERVVALAEGSAVDVGREEADGGEDALVEGRAEGLRAKVKGQGADEAW